MSLDHLCYTKCIGKEGKHHSSVNERNRLVNLRNTPPFERVKRDALTSAKNQTSFNTSAVVPNSEKIKPTSFKGLGPEWLKKCLRNKPRVKKSFTTNDVKVTYEELNSTGRYTATLSWKPFDIKLDNWTGYGIIYAILDPSSRRVHGLCQELDKSATNFTITNSSYGLTRGSSIAHYITSLPYPVQIPFYLLFACKVPTPCRAFMDQPTIRTGFATQFTAQRHVKSTGGDNEGVPNMAAAIYSTCASVLSVFLLLSLSAVNFIA